MAPNESAPHQHHHQQAVSTAPRSRPQPTTGVIAVADATMAKANRDRGRRGATAPSVPNWLRPMKRESGRANDDRRGSSAAARSAVSASATPTPTPTAGSSSSGGRTPLPNHHDRSTSLPLPQPRPSAPPQHESESPPPPAADTRRRIVSVSSPMDAASDHPVPVACSTKRKAPAPAPEDEEQSERERDGHLHHGHVLKSTGGGGGGGGPGGGGMIWMDEDEGTRIMMEATTALKKNSTRRMTTTATQGAEVQSKRTRRAAATSDDDTETLLSWRRKTGALPPPPPPPPLARQSGPPGNPKSIGVDSAVDGVIMAEDDTAAPLEEDCDFGLNITNEGASSGKISEELARATLQEAMLAEAMIMVPPRDTARPGSDWVPEPWAHSSERGALNVRPTHEIFSPTLPHEPSSSELSDAPDLDNSHALDSDDDVTSDSDLPLALLLAQPYGQSQQSSSAKKKPQSGKKGGTKARADGFDTADVEDTSSDDTPLAARHKRSSSGHAIANAAAETPHDRSHNARGGGRVKAKKATPLRRSDAREHAATPRTTPRKVPRAERSDTSDDEASDDDLALPAPSVRTPPRAKTACQWRVVEPPKSVVHPADAKRLSVTGIRPRVWTGGKDELIAALPALAKNRGGVAWRGLYYPTLIFSEDKGGPGLGWWKDDAWEGRRIAFSIVREVDLPLHPPVRQSVSAAHGSPFDAGCTMVDAPSLPETFPNPRATTSADNRESQAPAVPCSVNGNRESNGSSSGSPEVGPSRFSLENPPSAPSQSTCSMEVPYQRMNHSSHLDFLCDFDGDSGTLRRSVPSMYRGPDPSSIPATAEAICVDDPATFDGQSFFVGTHAGPTSPGVIHSPEFRGSDYQPPCSALAPTQNSLQTHTPHADACRPPSGCTRPYSSELAHANLVLPPCESETTTDPPDLATDCAPLLPCGSKNLHYLPFPQPPPEVNALLTTQSSGDVVSPVFARNSPLVPWGLPSEIGHFWLGLFKITDVKVETSPRQGTSKNTLTVQRAWRFSLEWVAGGEDLLLDDERHDYREWCVRIMRPWWEPEPEPVLLEQQRLSFSSECSRLLLPLSLLAPFTGNSTASGNFPVGYYCATCGRVNVQRFLRHRVCESATCNAGADVRRSEIGWVLSAFSTRDRKINSATISPDDKWSTPTTAEPAIGFDDGTRLFHYRLASSSTATSSTGDSGVPAPTASSSDDRSSSSIVVADAVAGSSSRSVRHIFNGNRAPLQARASALFETLQRDVRIERGIGATVFCTPVLESGDHHHHEMALEHRRDGDGDGRSTTWWGQQAGVIEGALRAYCCDLGPLRVHSLRIHAWVSDGKHRQTFCPRVKYLVLLCLGADISLLSIVPDSDSNAVKSGSKWKKESLRVTMVHGDSVVLSGGEFELLMVRAGMCMLLEAECV